MRMLVLVLVLLLGLFEYYVNATVNADDNVSVDAGLCWHYGNVVLMIS